MKGHVRRRGNKWCAVVDVGRDPKTGKRKQKWLSGFNSPQEAERALIDFLAKFNTGQYADSQNMTVETYLQKWLNDYAKLNVAKTTYDTYEDAVKHIVPRLGKIKLEKLRPIDIQSFVTELFKEGVSIRSIRYYYAVLNVALNTAIQWQLLAVNPCKGVILPSKNKTKVKTLNKKQVDLLLKESKNTPLYIPILLAVTCGMRRGEILGLRWNNVNFDNNTINITQSIVQTPNGEIIEKGPKSKYGIRTIAMPEITALELKALRKKQDENKLALGSEYKDGNFVVCWDNGEPYRPDYITHAFKKLIKKLNLPDIRFHDLRHTHATLLLEEGIHPKVVQERLGHSSITITLDTYSHVGPNLQKEAARKIDNILDNIS